MVCFSDNSQVVSMVNKGTSSSSVAMAFIRSIFWSSAINNFHLMARHVRGMDNIAADTLSRLYGKDLSSLIVMGLCCSRKAPVHESRPSIARQRDIWIDSIGMGPINPANQKLTMV